MKILSIKIKVKSFVMGRNLKMLFFHKFTFLSEEIPQIYFQYILLIIAEGSSQ